MKLNDEVAVRGCIVSILEDKYGVHYCWTPTTNIRPNGEIIMNSYVIPIKEDSVHLNITEMMDDLADKEEADETPDLYT